MEKPCYLSRVCIILSSLILGVVASLSHFAYQFSGNNLVVGIFNPVNESVWEHQKFMFFPLLLWWFVVYFIKRKQCNPQNNVWFTAASLSLVLAPLLTILMFYGYTSALGKELFAVDILLVFLVYFIVLNVANHILKYANPQKSVTAFFVILAIALLASFIVFTFAPPKIPLFYDSTTGNYGIIK